MLFKDNFQLTRQSSKMTPTLYSNVCHPSLLVNLLAQCFDCFDLPMSFQRNSNHHIDYDCNNLEGFNSCRHIHLRNSPQRREFE